MQGRSSSRRTFLTLTGASALSAVTGGRLWAAEAWPQRAVKLVVPFAAGSGTDTLSRMVGDRLSAAIGQPVVIENKGGASGMIGARSVAEAQPDGYTFLVGTQTTQAANVALFKAIPYDPVTAFAPISLLATVSVVVVVNPQLKINSIAELIAAARAKPGALTAGYGTGAAQIFQEMFQVATGTKFLGVPYKSNPQALTAVTANEISMMIIDLGTGRGLAEAKTVVPLAISGNKRSSLLPNVPTLTESGYKGFDADIWYGMFAPAATPGAILNSLQKNIHDALASTELREKLLAAGFEPAPSTPDQLAKRVRDDIASWTNYARLAGIVPQ